MGLIQCKPSKNIHIDNPPKYEENSNNPYKLNKTITASQANAIAIQIYEERYKSVIKGHLEEIYKLIEKKTTKGTNILRYIPCAGDGTNITPYVLDLLNKQKESELYKNMCDEICDILRKDGYKVELIDGGDRWKYGIPGYDNHVEINIKW